MPRCAMPPLQIDARYACQYRQLLWQSIAQYSGLLNRLDHRLRSEFPLA